jgi:hypothetical protein
MHELVPHPRHLSPRHSGGAVSERLRHALSRLADDLQIPDDGVLNHPRGEELVSTGLRIRERSIDSIADVQQVDPLVLQSVTASARILSRM